MSARRNSHMAFSLLVAALAFSLLVAALYWLGAMHPVSLTIDESATQSKPLVRRAEKRASHAGSSITPRSSKTLMRQVMQDPVLGAPPTDTDTLIHQLEDSIRRTGQKINEGHSADVGELKKETDQYDQFTTEAGIETICETGFNAGHSAARFLSQSVAHVYEFDLGVLNHDYAKTAESFLTAKFPGRLQVTWGDSTKTLPQFHATHPDIKCDLVIVDGGHQPEIAMADLKNFANMAASKHNLLIDDTPCQAAACAGPTKAWTDLVKQGCIKESMSVTMGENRGFRTGWYTACALWPNLGR